MPVEYKDYYKVLGVSKNASADEIRKEFRKLARQYHPDVAKNKAQAEEKFKEINEAYEVLSDPEKRKKYDELGVNWKQGGGFPFPPGAGQNRTWRGGGAEQTEDFEFGGTGFSDFFEQFFGSMGGRGGFGSRGSAQNFSERGQDMEADLMVTLPEAMRGSIRKITMRRKVQCDRCHGIGQIQNRICPTCGGEGKVARTENYQVKIPPGVREGQKLRLAGQGEAGVGRGTAGDLFLRVKFAAHPDFRVENGDLFHELELAPWEAALGASIAVPTLEMPINIKIPPATQNGQRLRLKERGLPDRAGKHGDLYVVTKIQMPKGINDRERAIWEQLARESHFNPRE